MTAAFPNVPTLLLGIIIVVVSSIATIAFTLLVRPLIKRAAIEGHNDIVGFVFAAVGVIYGVLLAFVVTDVWGSFDTAERATAQESSILLATYQDANTFPQPVRQIAQERLLAYAYSVVDYEWKTMAKGEPSPKSDAALQALFQDYRDLKPSGAWETQMYSESFTRLNDLTEARSLRLVASTAALPDAFWYLLIGGGVLTTAYASLFYLENTRIQMLLAVSLAVLLSATLFLVLVLDHPFAGDVHVSTENFTRVISQMSALPGGRSS